MKQRKILALALLFTLGALSPAAAREAGPDPKDTEIDLVVDQRIPMPDGIELSARIWRPANQREPLPAIFVLTPYVNDEQQKRAWKFVAAGYVYVSVDRRGRGGSDGEFNPLFGNGPDGAAVVAWIRRQPWSDGRVVMRGGSYRGMTQWQTLAENPPGLAAVVPTAAVYPGHDYPQAKGVFISYMAQWLAFTQGHVSNRELFGDDGYWHRKFLRLYQDLAPFAELAKRSGIDTRIFDRWLEHPAYDAFWQGHNPTPEDYRAMDLPILSITGYFDGDQPGALRYYREHLQHASAAARGKHYLLLGPWDHAGTRYPKQELGGFEFPEHAVLDLDQLHVDWYDSLLRGKSRPPAIKDQVTYYVMGADEWRGAPSLEALAKGTLRFYLASDGGRAGDPFHSGYLEGAPRERQSPDAFRYDPQDRATAEGYLDEVEDYNLDSRDAFRKGRLVYHSAPLAEPATLAGNMKLTLYVALDVPDTDLAAGVWAIEPTGRSLLLGWDMVRARYREGPSEARPVPAGAVLPYIFDSFWFTVRRLPAGTRLRLMVGPVDSPDFQRNFNSGGKIGHETAADIRAANVQLFHDTAHPSVLEVPVAE